MANYQLLKADIDKKVYQNGHQEITGENLNSVLNAMVTTLGAEYQFAGVATIGTNPGSPDAKVFYIANGKGTYTNFGSLEVTEDEVVVLYYDTEWHKVSTGIASNYEVNNIIKELDELFKDKIDVDFAISDENGNQIAQFVNGGIITKEFDSGKSPKEMDGGYYDFSIADANENPIMAIHNGFPKTKNFDGKQMAESVSILMSNKKDEIIINIADYDNNLVTAFDSINPSANKIFTILIPEGEYDVSSWFDANYDDKGLEIPDYVRLKGVGCADKIVIKWDNAEGAYKQWTSTLNTRNWNEIENITVVAKGIRYAVHDDLFQNALERHLVIKDCIFEADCSRVWGAGCTFGYNGVFENCKFNLVQGRFPQTGEYVEPFVLHDYPTSKSDSWVNFTNCRFITYKTDKPSLSFGFGTANGVIHATINGCEFSTFIDVGVGDNDSNTRITGFSNVFGSTPNVRFHGDTTEDINLVADLI